MNRLLFAAAIALLAWAPLPLGSNRPAAWLALALVIALLLALWSAAALLRRGPTLPADRRLWMLAALFAAVWLWGLLQTLEGLPSAWWHPLWAQAAAGLGQDLAGTIGAAPARGRETLILWAGHAAWFALILALSRRAGGSAALLRGLLAIATLYAIYGLIVQLGGWDTVLWYPRWAYHDSLTGPFVNRNSFATYAGLGLVVGLTLLLFDSPAHRRARRDRGAGASGRDWRDWRAARRGIVVVALLLLASALLLSQSRAGLAVAVLGLGGVLAIWLARRRASAAMLAGLALAGLGLAATVVAISGEAVAQRIGAGAGAGWADRLAIYRSSLDGIAAAPWSGHGLGAFETVFAGFRRPEMIDLVWVDKAHNSYLELAFEIGLPATLVLIGAWVGLVWRCRRGLGGGAPEPASIAAIAASLLVAAHATVDFSLQIPAVMLSYLAILAAGLGRALERADQRRAQ